MSPDRDGGHSAVSVLDDRFLVGDVLARGGMSTVFAATDRVADRAVVVKIMRSDRRDLGDRFAEEIYWHRRLDHPHIVAALTNGEVDELRYLVLERVHGPTVRQAVAAGGPMRETEVVRLGLQVGDALEHAHKRGVVHRDVKPSNVVLTPACDAKLIDFGLATAFGVGSPRERAGTFVGSPAFAAPEQVEDTLVDARTDVYGLGALLFFVLTGRPPFSGPDSASILAQQASGRTPRIEDVSSRRVSRGLRKVVERALERDPARRFRDIDAMTSALERIEDPRETGSWFLRASRPSRAGEPAATVRTRRRTAPTRIWRPSEA
jgi:serine/threonine-protein kinase